MAAGEHAMSVDDDEVAEVKSLWQRGVHMDVGARYLDALRKLGLDPDCLLWAEDEVIGHPVLVLVTDQFDRVGPLDLSRTLFKAYDLAGTPREVNPFILRLHSPRQAIIQEMDNAGFEHVANKKSQLKVAPFAEHGSIEEPRDIARDGLSFSAGGLKFRMNWVHKWKLPAKRLNAVEAARRWRRFSENVDRLAA